MPTFTRRAMVTIRRKAEGEEGGSAAKTEGERRQEQMEDGRGTRSN